MISARTVGRSALAVVVGFTAVTVLAILTNKLVRSSGLYPHGDPAAALVYRSIYTVLGGYMAARLAPCNAMWHALAVGCMVLASAVFGALTVLPMQFFGPPWYYFGLAMAALPCAWLGGVMYRRRHRQPPSGS